MPTGARRQWVVTAVMLASAAYPASGSDDIPGALALLKDGRIVVAAEAFAPGLVSDLVVTRYDAAGRLDRSFGKDGYARAHLAPQTSPAALAVRSDGGLIVAASARGGTPTGSDFALVAFRRDGRLDTAFGHGGSVVTDFAGDWDNLNAMIVEPDGKLVVAGHASIPSEGQLVALARYGQDGAPDATFGNGGRATSRHGQHASTMEDVNALGRQHDGKLVAAGAVDGIFTLLRFDTHGVPDASFGVNGIVQLGRASDLREGATALLVTPDDALVAAGTIVGDGRQDFGVVRFLPDGRNDEQFGARGVARTRLWPWLRTGLVAHSDGAVAVTGWLDVGFQRALGVARIRADGSADPAFGREGTVSTLLLGRDSPVAAVATPDGGLVVLGETSDQGPRDLVLIRYTRTGALDRRFGTGGIVTVDLDGGTGVAEARRQRAAVSVDSPALAACTHGVPTTHHASEPLGGNDAPVTDSGAAMSPFVDRKGVGFYAIDDPPPPPRSGDDTPLELRLVGPERRGPGEPVALTLTIHNRATKPVVFLEPVDSRRQPFYLLYLRDEGTGRMYQWDSHGATCGNVNAIGEQSYVTIAPGGEHGIGAWGGHVRDAVIPHAGRFQLWVAYVLCSLLTPEALFPLGEDVTVPTVERGIHVSNIVRVIQE